MADSVVPVVVDDPRALAEPPAAGRPAMPRLSVIVITKNEAHRIEACLRACEFADERVVLDSGSTDATRELARACGARVHVSDDWPGFGRQKNRALALSRGRWVLSIDADEVVSPALRAAVLAVVEADEAAGGGADGNGADGNGADGNGADGRAPPPVAWWVRRASSFCGRVVRFGDWRNDRVIRLFRRDRARFSDDVVHERVIVDADGPGAVAVLDGPLWHDSVESLADGRQKMRQYARLGAAKLRARGKGGWTSALTHAFWTFVRGYLVRGGLLDGWRGLAIAWLNTQGTFLRYLWAARPAPSERAARPAPSEHAARPAPSEHAARPAPSERAAQSASTEPATRPALIEDAAPPAPDQENDDVRRRPTP